MKFRVTSVTDEESGALLRDATVAMEDWLNASLSDGNFGEEVDQFIVVVIAVDSDPEENSRWAKSHDKTGKYKNPFTGEGVRFISSAIVLPPSKVQELGQESILSFLCAATIRRLALRPKRVPKGFDYERCSKAVSLALQVYAQPEG